MTQENIFDVRPKNEDPFLELRKKLISDTELRNKTGRCPVCGSNIADRTVSLYRGLINSLYKVYCWCGEHKQHEFETKEIRHLLNIIDYTRFGDLVRFGGLVYKPKDESGKSRKALFGLNMARCKEFFHGQREIPVQITLNQITGEIIDSHYIKIDEFPDLKSFLDENGLYDYEKII